MKHGGFRKMKKSAKRMHGPRRVLICGYSAQEQEQLLETIGKQKLGKLPVIFAGEEDRDRTVGEILGGSDGGGFGESPAMEKAIVVSGLTQKELAKLMAAYRKLTWPKPFWAAVTPTSETWTLRRLLEELAAENEALGQEKKG